MDFESIRLTAQAGITRLVLDRPHELNAMTPAMGQEIRAAVDHINANDSARVVVVSGAGRAFCSGANLKTLGKEAGVSGDGQGLGGGVAFYKLFLSIRDLRVPTIAALNGHAIGAGFCFALACDLRVMHVDAKVGMTFVKLGIHPGMAATWNLPRLIGPTRAADLLYTGRVLGAQECLSLGIVNRVAGDDFDAAVDELAGDIAASAPIAVRALKETLRTSERSTMDEALEAEAARQAMTFTTNDAAEGIRAVTEKRKPAFSGR